MSVRNTRGRFGSDIVWRQVPYLLRHKDAEEYYFVGECYVEGLMKGEAVPLEPKTSVEQTFFLV